MRHTLVSCWTHVLAIAMVTRVPSAFSVCDVSSATSSSFSSLLAALDPSLSTPPLTFDLCTKDMHSRCLVVVSVNVPF